MSFVDALWRGRVEIRSSSCRILLGSGVSSLAQNQVESMVHPTELRCKLHQVLLFLSTLLICTGRLQVNSLLSLSFSPRILAIP